MQLIIFIGMFFAAIGFYLYYLKPLFKLLDQVLRQAAFMFGFDTLALQGSSCVAAWIGVLMVTQASL